MADPVAVSVNTGTLLFLILAGCGLVGLITYSKFNQFLFGKQVKNEIKTEFLDKDQTKEIKRLEREIDKIQTK